MDFSAVRPDTISGASQAARSGDLQTLRHLVAAGGAEDDRSWLQVDNRGWTPLHHAANKGYSEICKILLKNKVDKSMKNNEFFTSFYTS